MARSTAVLPILAAALASLAPEHQPQLQARREQLTVFCCQLQQVCPVFCIADLLCKLLLLLRDVLGLDSPQLLHSSCWRGRSCLGLCGRPVVTKQKGVLVCL